MAPKKEYSMREVFEECQQGLHTHSKLMTALQKTYAKTEDKQAFNEEFIGFLKYSMVIFKREAAVERTLDFVTRFAASLAPEDDGEKENQPDASANFLNFLFDFLLKSHNGRDRAVRYRACQMINKLLSSLGEEAQIDDELYDQIYRCMLTRVQDKFPAVRVQAVKALARLQDPSDPDCPVIKAYLYLIEKDTNFEVRRTVLSCIAPAPQTLPSILQRTKDVKDSVRKMAYQVLAEKVHIRALTISLRVKVLQAGLSDHSDMVREVCTNKLLQSWLRAFDGNAIELLKRLDVENSCPTAELALKTVFSKVPVDGLVEDFDLLSEDLLILSEELSCENVLYWRCLVEHVRSKGPEAEVLMDRLLPNASAFCDYIRKYCDQLETNVHNVTAVEHTLKYEFVSEHLLKMTSCLDKSDEVGRKKLDVLVQELMIAPHVPPSLVPILASRLQEFHPEDDDRITLMAEVIADIREPITTVEHPIPPEEIRKRELKLAGVRMELTQARDALEESVARQDFSSAAEMKQRVEDLECTKNSLLEESLVVNTTQEIRTEKSDGPTLLKCLTIAAEVMQHLSVKELNPTLQTLVDTLVLPGITNEDASVRNMAVKCLGLGAQISRVFAMQQLLLLMQISQVDQETVQVTAIQAIFDVAQTYGLDIFRLPEGGEQGGAKEGGEEEEEEEKKKEDEDEEEEEDGEAKKDEQAVQSAANSALSILTKLLDNESNELRTVAASGLAKLLLSGRITSPKLLSRLLLLWYNPTSEEDQLLRACLGAFFPIYSFAGRMHQECWEETFLPTLKTLFNAPTTSPLAEVNPNNVAEFMVHLTDHTMLNTRQAQEIQETTVHDNLALKLANALLEDPEAPGARVLARTLTLLTISGHNQTHLADIKVLSDLLLEHVQERVAFRLVEKFSDAIDGLLTEKPEEGGKTNDRTAAEGADMVDEEGELDGEGKENGGARVGKSASSQQAAKELSEECQREAEDMKEKPGRKTRGRGKSTKTPAQKKTAKTPGTRGRRKAVKQEVPSDNENESDDLGRSKVKHRTKKLAELIMSSEDSDPEMLVGHKPKRTTRDKVLKVLNFADDDSS